MMEKSGQSAAATQRPLLEVEQVGIVFGGLVALDDVNMCVDKGEIHGLIGPNGSGKTTLINIITGFYSPTSGKVMFDGKKVSDLVTYKINHIGLGRTFQNVNLFAQMSVLENVATASCVHSNYGFLSAMLNGKKFRASEKLMYERAESLLELVGLSEERDMLAGNLPYGKQRLLEIARMLATEPKLVLLDEPVAGMNDQESGAVAQLVQKLRSEYNKTILLIEHHMRFVMDICDNLTVLNSGKVIAEGKPKDIQNNDDVIDCYLGRKRGILNAAH